MKTKLVFLFFVVCSTIVKSQEINCVEKSKEFSQYIADNEFEKATDKWNDISKNCAFQNEKNFQLAEIVLQHNIQLAAPENKELAVRQLINMYTLYDLNFPSNKNGNYVKSAMALYENKVGASYEVFSYLDLGFEKQRETFQNATALYVYFELYFADYKSGKSKITMDQLLNKYSSVISLAEKNRKENSEKADEFGRVIMSVNSLLIDVLNCKNLVPYCQKYLDTNKSDVFWLEVSAKALSSQCKTEPVFFQIASELYAIKPTSKSTYYLALYYLNTGKQDKAIEYFSESVTLATDLLEKAKTAYTVASILATTDKAKSNEMVLTAIKNEPTNGKYFIFLADLYASSVDECTSNVSEKNAVYKLASNTVLKAATVEPRLKSTAEKLSLGYLKNSAPDSKKRKSVTIGCWINQKVQL